MIAPGVLAGELYKRALDLSARNGLDLISWVTDRKKSYSAAMAWALNWMNFPLYLLIPGKCSFRNGDRYGTQIHIPGYRGDRGGGTFIVTDSGHKKLTAAPYEIEMKECF